MNIMNFNLSVGFPFETQTLDEMQKCWEILNAFGDIVAPLAIIKGCVVTGLNVSDGFVYINGELLKFVGGAAQATVVIVETPETGEFEDGSEQVILKRRYATFGAGTTQYNWADFKRPMTTAELTEVLPSLAPTSSLEIINTRLTELEAKTAVFQQGGGMVLWNKPAGQIPAGWAEVVNWRGRIPVGQDTTQPEFATMGQTGGNKKINFNVTVPITGYGVGGQTGFGTQGKLIVATGAGESGEYLESLNQAGNTVTASATDVNIMNPYRVVMFIEWVGL